MLVDYQNLVTHDCKLLRGLFFKFNKTTKNERSSKINSHYT